jgi:general secretion pathway protein E
MSLIPLLTRISKQSGCADAMRCEAVLAEAASRRAPLVDALYDAGLVDEESFAQQLAEEAGLDFQAESELDLTSALHRRFPAKLALRHRLLPGRIDEEGRVPDDLRSLST